MADIADPAVFGIYSTKRQTDAAVDALRQAGFQPADISALFSENQESRDFAQENQTKAPEGTATGPTAEVELAGSSGITHPATGLIKGALSDALLGMGVPPDEVETYGDLVVKDGGILLSVQCHTSEDVPHAKVILFKTGAGHMFSTAGDSSPGT